MYWYLDLFALHRLHQRKSILYLCGDENNITNPYHLHRCTHDPNKTITYIWILFTRSVVKVMLNHHDKVNLFIICYNVITIDDVQHFLFQTESIYLFVWRYCPPTFFLSDSINYTNLIKSSRFYFKIPLPNLLKSSRFLFIFRSVRVCNHMYIILTNWQKPSRLWRSRNPHYLNRCYTQFRHFDTQIYGTHKKSHRKILHIHIFRTHNNITHTNIHKTLTIMKNQKSSLFKHMLHIILTN